MLCVQASCSLSLHPLFRWPATQQCRNEGARGCADWRSLSCRWVPPWLPFAADRMNKLMVKWLAIAFRDCIAGMLTSMNTVCCTGYWDASHRGRCCRRPTAWAPTKARTCQRSGMMQVGIQCLWQPNCTQNQYACFQKGLRPESARQECASIKIQHFATISFHLPMLKGIVTFESYAIRHMGILRYLQPTRIAVIANGYAQFW